MFFVLLKIEIEEFILIIKYKVKYKQIKNFLCPVLNFEKNQVTFFWYKLSIHNISSHTYLP